MKKMKTNVGIDSFDFSKTVKSPHDQPSLDNSGGTFFAEQSTVHQLVGKENENDHCVIV
jgi:hypothetical protein